MNAPINHQVIEKDGQPLFVLVPYDEYQSMVEKDVEVTIPHDVVERHILEEVSLVRAWREYKKMSQEDVAKKMNISQSAYSQMEKPDAKLRTTTVTRIASALEVSPEQLVV